MKSGLFKINKGFQKVLLLKLWAAYNVKNQVRDLISDDIKLNIIRRGSEMVHKNGYNNTSINDICKAAGVPKGSFYYYFGSKDDYAAQIISFYYDFMFSMQKKHLDNVEEKGAIKRLRDFFNDFKHYFQDNKCSGGCPIGNLAQELSDSSEFLREKLADTLEATKKNIELFLMEAKAQNEIPSEADIQGTADFIFNSWEGSLMRMKVTKSIAPMELFDMMIFDILLKERKKTNK